jgi:hypothetical protein
MMKKQHASTELVFPDGIASMLGDVKSQFAYFSGPNTSSNTLKHAATLLKPA